jgi:hypothetical protein
MTSLKSQLLMEASTEAKTLQNDVEEKKLCTNSTDCPCYSVVPGVDYFEARSTMPSDDQAIQ